MVTGGETDPQTSGSEAQLPGRSKQPKTWRVVLITLGAVALAALVVGGGALGYRWYTGKNDDLQAAEERVAELETANNRLTAEVGRQKRRADSSFRRGLDAAREIDRDVGLDFDSGYNAAFEGFGTWQTDAYYFVRIIKGEGKQKYEITSRGLFEPCKAYILESDSIFTRAEPC